MRGVLIGIAWGIAIGAYADFFGASRWVVLAAFAFGSLEGRLQNSRKSDPFSYRLSR